VCEEMKVTRRDEGGRDEGDANLNIRVDLHHCGTSGGFVCFRHPFGRPRGRRLRKSFYLILGAGTGASSRSISYLALQVDPPGFTIHHCLPLLLTSNFQLPTSNFSLRPFGTRPFHYSPFAIHYFLLSHHAGFGVTAASPSAAD
jgi:hypothetical protein